MRAATWMAGLAVLGMAVGARAADREKVEPWQFKAVKGGKAAGRYDFSVVARDTGVFAVSMTYGDPKAVAKKKPGRPEVRTYAELEPSGQLGRYKRWKAKGKGALYWLAFVFEGKAKIRFEREDGSKAKVTELGDATEVFPLEADQPLLAWLLVRGKVEREVACMGTGSTVLGKARVRRLDGVEGGEGWKIEGDCGAFTVVVDAAGEPRSITADGRAWERLPPAGS